MILKKRFKVSFFLKEIGCYFSLYCRFETKIMIMKLQI